MNVSRLTVQKQEQLPGPIRATPVPKDPTLRRLALSSLRTRPILIPDGIVRVKQERYLRQRRKAREMRRLAGGGLQLMSLCPRYLVGPDGTVYAKTRGGSIWPLT